MVSLVELEGCRMTNKINNIYMSNVDAEISNIRR